MQRSPNILIIGAGGVGAATAHKCAQNNTLFGNICIACRHPEQCDRVIRSIHKSNNVQSNQYHLRSAAVDARQTTAVVNLIRQTNSTIVLNVGSPFCNMSILKACLAAGAHYLDTSVAESDGEENMPAPWYGNYEWTLKEAFAQQGLTALLSIGFDPGVVNVFAAYAHQHLFDSIDTIDILDVNAGNHGRYFATNFDPEVNLREIMEDVQYWEDGQYRKIPCHTRRMDFSFPGIGRRQLYSVGHDELHSLPIHIPARRIEFWMGFNEHYLQVFNVLKNLGLLSSVPIQIDDGITLAPIKVVKSVLPNPADLAEGYTGNVCIGNLVHGIKAGKARTVFIYSTCSHEACFADVRSQAISYTTAIPIVTAALLLAEGDWNPRRMVNVEELDPMPFLQRMSSIGIDWTWREETPTSPPR